MTNEGGYKMVIDATIDDAWVCKDSILERLEDEHKEAIKSIEITNVRDVHASKYMCRRLWTSLGVFVAMLPFLDYIEAVSMQCLNQFSYQIAIGRVHTRLALYPEEFYLKGRDEVANQDKVFCFNQRLRTCMPLDLSSLLSAGKAFSAIQVRQSLFCLE